MKSDKKDESVPEQLRRYGNLGLEMAASVVIGTLAGYGLDRWLGTTPLFFLIGFVFGAAAGILSIIRLAVSEEKKREKKKGP